MKSAAGDGASSAADGSCEDGPEGVDGDLSGPAADVRRIAAALEALPADEREAVAEHVEALAKLSPKRRAAILALTAEA